MVLGFNHNVMYKGEVFHVQTEDSGVALPHIITLLYRGGVILCSQKTSYADILKIDNLETVVEELMKEQHKGMMRRLKSGEFDERAFPAGVPAAGVGSEPDSLDDVMNGEYIPSAPSADEAGSCAMDEMLNELQGTLPKTAPDEPAAGQEDSPKELLSLDDAILAFFAEHEK